MQDATSTEAMLPPAAVEQSREEIVSTHVLVPELHAQKLRELSRRTRVAQSEYLREAVDDLLSKYPGENR